MPKDHKKQNNMVWSEADEEQQSGLKGLESCFHFFEIPVNHSECQFPQMVKIWKNNEPSKKQLAYQSYSVHL